MQGKSPPKLPEALCMQLGRPRAWAGRESERGTDLFSNCNCFSLFCWGGRWLDSVGPNFHQWSPIAAQNLEMRGGGHTASGLASETRGHAFPQLCGFPALRVIPDHTRSGLINYWTPVMEVINRVVRYSQAIFFLNKTRKSTCSALCS